MNTPARSPVRGSFSRLARAPCSCRGPVVHLLCLLGRGPSVSMLVDLFDFCLNVFHSHGSAVCTRPSTRCWERPLSSCDLRQAFAPLASRYEKLQAVCVCVCMCVCVCVCVCVEASLSHARGLCGYCTLTTALLTGKVSHHPPITMLHAESVRGWRLVEEYRCDTKFRGTLKVSQSHHPVMFGCL
jgi:hypothetical protein